MSEKGLSAWRGTYSDSGLRARLVARAVAVTVMITAGSGEAGATETLPGRVPADGPSFLVFAGILTNNNWTEAVFQPWDAELTDPGLFGVAIALPVGPVYDLGKGSLGFSVEWQIVRHSGYQDFWETSLPASVRYRPDVAVAGVLDGLGFGIGPSYTSSESPHEGSRGGGSVEKALVYWYLELDHLVGISESSSLILRLHHRSDAFGLMGDGGASNALAIGLRQSF